MTQNPIDPFAPEVYQARKIHSARDCLLVGVDTALLRMQATFEDLTDDECHWEPLSEAERRDDMLLSAEEKRVWRVFEPDGTYVYDYSLTTRTPSPFTTIAWIMNHLAQTADMYLYCIKTGRPEGEDRMWDDLPVHSNLSAMRQYAFTAVLGARHYLVALNETHASAELNTFTPTPWGEMRPTYLNLWGGVIEHVVQHTMQIAVRKERIREVW